MEAERGALRSKIQNDRVKLEYTPGHLLHGQLSYIVQT